jgi:DNA-binding transcriptional MerR regulator
MDPATRLVRSLPGNYHKLVDAAEILGVSDNTLRFLIQEAVKAGDPKGAPSKYVMMKKTKIYLYSDEDIERIRALLASRHEVKPFDMTATGRPPVYTAEERAERTKLNARAWYYRNRIEELEAKDAPKKEIAAAKKKLREIEDERKRTEKVKS